MRKILLLGNFGREHALAKAIKESEVELINWAPISNPGIARIADKMIIEDYHTNIAKDRFADIDLAIIGPENPLVDGVADALESIGITIFAPSAKNARIEGSKVYMRQLLEKEGIDGNISFRVCSTKQELIDAIEMDHHVAVKPDGLTHGKGVKVWGSHFKTKELVLDYAQELLTKDGIVLLEEQISGIEFSLQAMVKNDLIFFFPLVKDYKRAYENDVGGNTGSMGACSFPDHMLPYLNDDQIKQAKNIMHDVVKALNRDNGEYKGFLYGQFMLADDGIKVIEFNARLGDPEAINVLGLLKKPLLDIITDLYDGIQPEPQFIEKASVCVYIVPEGYPENPKGGSILKASDFPAEQLIIASVDMDNGDYISTKSRCLAVIGYGNSIREAKKNVYDSIPKNMDAIRYRKDIGTEFL